MCRKPSFCACAIALTIICSNLARLYKPVRASWDACQDSWRVKLKDLVTSWKIITIPIISPKLLQIGAAEYSIAYSVPLQAISRVQSAKLITLFSSKTFSTGLGIGSRLDSLIMRNTSDKGFPTANSAFQPVSFSAIWLKFVILPTASVVITASPIDCKVTWASSFSFCNCFVRSSNWDCKVSITSKSSLGSRTFNILDWLTIPCNSPLSPTTTSLRTRSFSICWRTSIKESVIFMQTRGELITLSAVVLTISRFKVWNWTISRSVTMPIGIDNWEEDWFTNSVLFSDCLPSTITTQLLRLDAINWDKFKIFAVFGAWRTSFVIASST